ncbi:mannose-1-phosphate guanylyltransferase/mannose-6-phosphate isomerase [Endozoicomonas sp. SCSIO W0465]|uniref:mannose-1-phosphate guanylyltransferase/mannose-6-phosphate isomerase n=1 Tax=Endozoicomonas sp. SCSIO W0465 TaxID=2918516 RepID=UPI0020758678|nr:mannose-1-phosphate guanylyltransferase/mannose-6-phosphate isomerase [Endozoicomonas sp. SCSIO W0465]USE35705.1 mannose-1-phosphate guanylyltransferase/mannose-6-phosphate isomerase [Endozoicomonas sp. SCSIO W0465]
MTLIPVIMSGGSGSRLWPQSRSLYPKQFLPLVNEQTMLQNTITRLDGIEGVSAPLVVANEEHRFLVAEQFRQMGREALAIILEPVGRNTAPAVALAALKAQSASPEKEPLLLVLAADHAIQNVEAFHQAVEAALPAARDGKLVTFGIVPTHPETGYGYIKASKELIGHSEQVALVEQFVEKPDHDKAKAYLASGDYYWNSGMFLFKASRYLEELKQYRPDILDACEKAMTVQDADLDFVRLDVAAFEACPDESIDYAVMENTSDAVVVPLDAGWSDVGSWTSLADISEQDDLGNSSLGDVLLEDTRNTYVRSEKKLIATVGVDDLIITESDDAILVAHKSRVQDVKKIVERLKTENRPEVKLHRKVYRPWGAYDSIDMGDRFQVKRITVKPGAQLSLQMHHHRAEHWIVVKGTALVTNGDQQILLTENQSTYIPIGTVHRLENPGKFDLEMIEVQSGGYLGEDDIVRFEDTYGRA